MELLKNQHQEFKILSSTKTYSVKQFEITGWDTLYYIVSEFQSSEKDKKINRRFHR